MELILIAAVGINGGIGADGELGFSLQEDMAHFKKETYGHVVIMGRKTFDSIGRPLKNRVNIVISRLKHWNAEGIIKVNTIGKALSEANKHFTKKVYVIGGASIYKQMIETCDELIITRTNRIVEGADSFFPKIPAIFKADKVRYSIKSNLIFINYKKNEHDRRSFLEKY